MPGVCGRDLLERLSSRAGDMAFEDGDVDGEERRIECDRSAGRQQGQAARLREGPAQCEQGLAQAGLRLAGPCIRPEEPLKLLTVVRLSGMEREVGEERLRLLGGQVKGRRAGARLEPSEKGDCERLALWRTRQARGGSFTPVNWAPLDSHRAARQVYRDG